MAVIRTKGKGRKRQLLAGVSGHIGMAVVVKQYKGRIVLANFPSKSSKKRSKAQKSQERHFGDAVAYAQWVIADPMRKAAFKRKFKIKTTVNQAAISAYMKGEVDFGSIQKVRA